MHYLISTIKNAGWKKVGRIFSECRILPTRKSFCSVLDSCRKGLFTWWFHPTEIDFFFEFTLRSPWSRRIGWDILGMRSYREQDAIFSAYIPLFTTGFYAEKNRSTFNLSQCWALSSWWLYRPVKFSCSKSLFLSQICRFHK